jgi:hypothetical protein
MVWVQLVIFEQFQQVSVWQLGLFEALLETVLLVKLFPQLVMLLKHLLALDPDVVFFLSQLDECEDWLVNDVLNLV